MVPCTASSLRGRRAQLREKRLVGHVSAVGGGEGQGHRNRWRLRGVDTRTEGQGGYVGVGRGDHGV